ncbi:MAG: DNA primase [Verrucomicrobiota bacterium]
MGQISKETIERVRQATDIVDLINSYVLLKRAGTAFKACCPFHNEKTPSFQVNPARQSFHCFGCGKGGDAIAFITEYENLPFTDAVKRLAQRAGIAVVEDAHDPQEDENRRARGRLMDLLRDTAQFMHERLLRDPAAEHARAYMKSRGFGAEMAKRWLIGWMPRNPAEYLNWAKDRKFAGRDLVASGMAGLRDENHPAEGLYVRFTDRLMFPIRNEIGDVIAFSGRKLREEQQGGKYQNSPATPVFNKSRVLFALDRAKRPILTEKRALLCEGQLDVIACHEAGVEQAIATQGTALTTEHAMLLKRYTKDVVICYDADAAGLTSTDRAFRELAAQGLSVRVVRMPAGDDPDSFLKTHGAAAFGELVDGAAEFFDFKLDLARSDGRLDDATQRATLLALCAEMLAVMTDFAARENMINVVAGRLQVSATVLREEIAGRKRRERSRPKGAEPESPLTEAREIAAPMHHIVAFLSELALGSLTAQHFLAEQFESLHEAAPWVEGITILEKILAAGPDPRSPAAIHEFMGSLTEPERLALVNSLHADSVPGEDLQAAEQALAALSAVVLQKRDIAVKAALKQPGISPEKTIALLEEAKELSALMREMRQRSHFDDELPASTWKPKEPEWKKRWRQTNQ